MHLKVLEELGLSDKEAKTYLVLLGSGPVSVSEIASRAKINRVTAYDILESLIGYGLISRTKEKKSKKYYIANNPQMLISYLDNKVKEFKAKSDFARNILPELISAYNTAPLKPNIKYFSGQDGIISIYEDSLTSQTEILSWLDSSQLKEFSAKYFEDYFSRRAKKGIFIKAIVSDTETARQYQKRDQELNRELRIVPGKMIKTKPECYIYDNKVAYMSLREKFGVIIESQDIADAHRDLYDLAWKMAGEIQKTNSK